MRVYYTTYFCLIYKNICILTSLNLHFKCNKYCILAPQFIIEIISNTYFKRNDINQIYTLIIVYCTSYISFLFNYFLLLKLVKNLKNIIGKFL